MTVDLEHVPVIEAVHFGPTWERMPDWDGANPATEFILPERTLGWQILDWIEANLLNDEGEAFVPTREQRRFILWWFAVDERGKFMYRNGVLQRLKGWGKDPVAAVLAAVELVGPCRFSHWAAEDDSAMYGVLPGEPVGVPHPRAWIQVAAVSLVQTRNTMTIFPGLFSKACMSEHGIDIGKEIIYAYNGSRRIEAVTSSPRALEGGRPTFVIKNETHHWLANNDGHGMADVIERNATKAKGGGARSLSITNAYEPGEDSVAEQERVAWEDEDAGLAIATGMLYDSLEAPKHADMLPPGVEQPTDDEVKEYLASIIRGVRGDSDWLDVESIVKSILDRKNSPSRSRRYWFNQIVTPEDAWVKAESVDAAVDPLAKQERENNPGDILRAGWLLMPGEEVCLFFDGSKSDDDTALMGCRMSDGYVFTAGHWHKPRGAKPGEWLCPRHEVDHRVREIHERFTVKAFFADPSHAVDEDSGRYWDPIIDTWHRDFKDSYDIWAVRTGDRQHSVMWDMTNPQRTAEFVGAAELFADELGQEDSLKLPAPQFAIDGHPALVRHLKNAKRYPSKWGTSLWKGHRESQRKIDLAVAAVGARHLRRLVLNKGVEEEERAGEVWW